MLFGKKTKDDAIVVKVDKDIIKITDENASTFFETTIKNYNDIEGVRYTIEEQRDKEKLKIVIQQWIEKRERAIMIGLGLVEYYDKKIAQDTSLSNQRSATNILEDDEELGTGKLSLSQIELLEKSQKQATQSSFSKNRREIIAFIRTYYKKNMDLVKADQNAKTAKKGDYLGLTWKVDEDTLDHYGILEEIQCNSREDELGD